MSKKRLGRGLDALISTTKDKENQETNNKVKKINLDSISSNPYQPRKDFIEKDLEELSQSIKEHGLIQPIIVRKVDQNYQIVAGERRYRAAKRINLDRIDAIVEEFDDQQAMEIALIENIQRQDLNPIEEAKAYQELMNKFNLLQEEIGKRVGKSRSAISNSLRLLRLPDEIKEYVSRGTLAMGHARALLSVEDNNLQKELAKEVINKELTVREIEKLIKKIGNEDEEESKKKEVKRDPNLVFVENKLKDILGTKVNIKDGKKKGKIIVEYYSNQDLERIIELLENQT